MTDMLPTSTDGPIARPGEPFSDTSASTDEPELRAAHVERRDDELMIACETIRAEIEHIASRIGVERDIVWLESGLHNTPDLLKTRLQESLDAVEGRERVLLGYGNCGNVVQGLHTGDFELIIPRLDDCISLLIGSQSERMAISDRLKAIYQTQGWMDAGHNILDDWEKTVDMYDEETAQDVFEMMYGHYRTMAFLDTGLYSIPDLAVRLSDICGRLHLEQKVLPTTFSYIEELIEGPWPLERFVHVAPGSVVEASEFLPGSSDMPTFRA